MTQTQMLEFIKRKLSGDEAQTAVLRKYNGKSNVRLGELFEELKLNAHELNTDKLAMHAVC
jgi:hypothetical protein